MSLLLPSRSKIGAAFGKQKVELMLELAVGRRGKESRFQVGYGTGYFGHAI